MKQRALDFVVTLLVLGVAVSVAPALADQGPARRVKSPTTPAKGWMPLRTGDGKPDFQGYWRFSEYPDGTPGTDGAALDIQASQPTSELDRFQAPSMVIDPPDGKIPYIPSVLAKKNEYVSPGHVYAGAVDPHVRCWRNGPPRSVYAPNGLQILQNPGNVVILGEYSHNYRVIPTDGRPHLGKDIPLFIGDSRGYWEGDTLVVDTTNYNGQFWLDAAGDFTSPTLHLVERWTLVEADTIYYEATLDDSNMYTHAWKIGLHLARRKEADYELIEFACHEGEQSLKNILDVTPAAK